MIEVHTCDLGMNVRESLDQFDAFLDLKIKFSSEIFETSWWYPLSFLFSVQFD